VADKCDHARQASDSLFGLASCALDSEPAASKAGHGWLAQKVASEPGSHSSTRLAASTVASAPASSNCATLPPWPALPALPAVEPPALPEAHLPLRGAIEQQAAIRSASFALRAW
jgi:hypothetical protein